MLLDELGACIEFDDMTKTDHHIFYVNISLHVGNYVVDGGVWTAHGFSETNITPNDFFIHLFTTYLALTKKDKVYVHFVVADFSGFFKYMNNQ